MLYLPAEFPQDSELFYLNHAAVSPWPKRTAEAVQKFAFENMTRGAELYPSWMESVQSLRERMAWLIKAASPDDIAFVKNTSEGLSFVANGIDWNAGDEIVGICDDFPSNRVVWEALSDKSVKFKSVDINAEINPEEALVSQFNGHTRLLAVSSAHFSTGLTLNLKFLSRACKQHNVLLCVDAIQTLGALSFDLKEVEADFVIADGHKWMLGPEGIGLFYVNPDIRADIGVSQFGWAMRENVAEYSPAPWKISSTARKYECGSPNMMGVFALNASLGLIKELGFEQIETRIQKNVAILRESLESLDNCTVRTPEDAKAGIISFSIEGVDSAELYSQLMKRRVICANRGDFVRFSPHFYTPESVLEGAINHLKFLIK